MFNSTYSNLYFVEVLSGLKRHNVISWYSNQRLVSWIRSSVKSKRRLTSKHLDEEMPNFVSTWSNAHQDLSEMRNFFCSTVFEWTQLVAPYFRNRFFTIVLGKRITFVVCSVAWTCRQSAWSHFVIDVWLRKLSLSSKRQFVFMLS